MRHLKHMAAVLGLSAGLLTAQPAKEFPAHWGQPPAIQTQDYVELPAGYGHGSSTLARWITANVEKDKSGPAGTSPLEAKLLYENDFESVAVGKVPEDFLVLQGEFAVKEFEGNKVLELPGAPLETFGFVFGPPEISDVIVSARIFGTGRGRRYPTLGVGLNGAGGYKLRVSPAKNALETCKGDDVRASAPFDWKSGEWTQFRLRLRKVKEGEWKVEGKVWTQGAPEPDAWMISFDEKEPPTAGRASIWGSPFSGTPIRFDDLKLERVDGRP